jgi:hypothetical protein
MAVREYAEVSEIRHQPRTRHYLGLPPGIIERSGPGEDLPLPQVVIIEETPSGFMLDRYTKDGRFGGDTWHVDLDEAKSQAEYEYGDSLGAWNPIPAEVEDTVAFTLARIK